jgi:hypothetical protein
MQFNGIVAIYSENHTKYINAVCGQNAELLIVKASGIYRHRSALHSQFARNFA